MSKSIVLSVLTAAAVASAADVQVRSTTLLTGAPELTNPANQVQTTIPLYEMVGLNVRKIELPGFDDLAVSLDGWASLATPNLSADGDVNVAYVEALTLARHLRVRVGRQIVLGGGTRMLAVDGAMVEVRIVGGFGVSGFIGNPVVRRFSNYTHGDLAAGGRAFFAPSTSLQVGASFTNITERGDLVRQEVGADARWNLHRSLTVTANALWSVPDARLAEFDVGPRWQPIPELEFSAAWRRTAPDLFLPRTSIFTVFADTQRDEVGGMATWQVLRTLSLGADGHAIWLNGQAGYDADLLGTLRPSKGSSLTAQVHRLSVPVNGYTQGRLAGRYTFAQNVAVHADLDLYVLDQPIRNVTTSFSWSAGATWTITPRWLVGVSVMGGTNPYYERHTEFMAKVTFMLPEVRS